MGFFLVFLFIWVCVFMFMLDREHMNHNIEESGDEI